MSTVTGQSVGIDISEDFLDVYLHPAGKEVRLPHNDEGTASLLALLRDYTSSASSWRAPGGSSGGWCGPSRRRGTPSAWSTPSGSGPTAGWSAGWPRPTGSTPG